MGVCKSKTIKLNTSKTNSQTQIRIKTQPTITIPSNQEIKINTTRYDRQKLFTNGTSPLSDGVILTQRNRRKLTKLPQTNFQITLDSMKHILVPTCASKKYTLIRKQKKNDLIQIVSNNKTGKIMQMETFGKNEENNINYIQWLQNNQIDHINIIRVSEIFENPKYYQVIYEYFDENTLQDLIQEGKKVSKIQISQILQQILQILQYLHEQKLYHGNLSLKSFSYKIQNDQSYLIKLIDLKSIIIKEDDDMDFIKFTPPESLYSSIYDAHRDIWAAVLIAYTLRKGQFPIEIQEPITIQGVKVILKNSVYKFDHKKDKIFKDFLTQSLNKNPKKRPKLEQLLNHQFITQYQAIKKSDQELLLCNILDAKPSCLLQQLFLNYFLQEYNWEEYLKIQKLFLEGDLDMNGYMSKDELINLMKKYNFQIDIEEKIENIFLQLELKDQINSTQFLSLISNKKEILTQWNIEACFSIFSFQTQSITLKGLKKHLMIDDFEEVKSQFSQLTGELNYLNLEQFKKLIELLI